MPRTIMNTLNSPMMRYAMSSGSHSISSSISRDGGTYYLNFMQDGALALEQVKDRTRTISTVEVTIDRDDASSFGPMVFAEFSALYAPINRSAAAFSEEELNSDLDHIIVNWARELRSDLYEQIS